MNKFCKQAEAVADAQWILIQKSSGHDVWINCLQSLRENKTNERYRQEQMFLNV